MTSSQDQLEAVAPAGPAEAGDAAFGTRPTFTITEAATACAVSRKTITRKLAELAESGAAKDADGIWRIPVEALLSVGLHPGRSLTPGASRREPVVDLRAAAPRPVPGPEAAPAPDTVTVPRDRWDDLRIRLARAEAESIERGRALEDARLALRALTAGPSASSPIEPPAPPTSHAVAATVAMPMPSATMPSATVPSATVPASASEGGYEVPEPVPGLPPTPVPQSLAADSSVWDTLLPRSSAPAVPPPPPETPVLAETPVMPPQAQPQYPTTHFTLAEPPQQGQVVSGPARRRWWGGKR